MSIEEQVKKALASGKTLPQLEALLEEALRIERLAGFTPGQLEDIRGQFARKIRELENLIGSRDAD